MSGVVDYSKMSELPSKGAKYLSVSVTVVLLSEEQRARVYEALHKDRRILYYL